jgi:excisionase family DNA binding protein
MNLLSVSEVAQQLGISSKTVRKLIASGQLRAGKVAGKWRIEQDDLDLFWARRRT